jgi:hypothetical protein
VVVMSARLAAEVVPFRLAQPSSSNIHGRTPAGKSAEGIGARSAWVMVSPFGTRFGTEISPLTPRTDRARVLPSRPPLRLDRRRRLIGHHADTGDTRGRGARRDPGRWRTATEQGTEYLTTEGICGRRQVRHPGALKSESPWR